MNSGAAPVVNAPKSGPPVALIVIVILVIIGIIVGVVMSTPVVVASPAPVVVTSPSPMAPSPAAVTSPSPMAPSPAAPFRPSPMPVPVLVAPPPTGYQFDESCVKPALQTVFQGDAPFIPDYINFLKSSKVQTAPLGSPCPSGTTSEKAPPDMKCQACVPNELINKQPPMPDTLQKQIMDWNQKQSGAMDSKKQEVQGMPAPRPNEVGGTAGSKEVGGKMAVGPPPAAVPVGSSPVSSMGREMAVSAVIRTPEEMLTAKQAQVDMRYAEPKLTNEQLAQAQRDAGKKVDIPKDPRLQENITTMKIGDVKDPRQQQAQEFGMKIGLLPAQMGGTKSYYEVEPYHK